MKMARVVRLAAAAVLVATAMACMAEDAWAKRRVTARQLVSERQARMLGSPRQLAGGCESSDFYGKSGWDTAATVRAAARMALRRGW